MFKNRWKIVVADNIFTIIQSYICVAVLWATTGLIISPARRDTVISHLRNHAYLTHGRVSLQATHILSLTYWGRMTMSRYVQGQVQREDRDVNSGRFPLRQVACLSVVALLNSVPMQNTTWKDAERSCPYLEIILLDQ